MKRSGRNLPTLIMFFSLVSIFTVQNICAEGITIVRSGNRTELLLENPEKINGNSVLELQLAGEGKILLSGETGSTELNFSMGGNPEKVQIYTSLTGFIPVRASIAEYSPDFDILSASIITPDAGDPMPADIGQIIFSDFEPRNGHDWEIYSWNLVPEVLIFDTVDYEVQARLFKRLAFFVEKPGFTGRLVPNSELEGRHGWNAHDYKADDLAEFFTKAENESFRLNAEELELRKVLTDAGIIRKTASGEYREGRGAVLSVSRETLPNWRYRFLTHECLHGLFFTDEQFQSEIFQAFSELEPEEVEFWKHLLDYRNYDVSNNYLLVNEFMAYSLQQPMEEVDEYFKGFLYTRMLAARPYEKDFVAEFDKNFNNSFIFSVTKLEKILYNHTGRITGHLANLYPAGVEDSFFNLFPSL